MSSCIFGQSPGGSREFAKFSAFPYPGGGLVPAQGPPGISAHRERVSARRAVRSVLCVQAQRPIESAAERTGASVGPEGPTERYDQRIRRRVPERVSARRAVRSARNNQTTRRPGGSRDGEGGERRKEERGQRGATAVAPGDQGAAVGPPALRRADQFQSVGSLAAACVANLAPPAPPTRPEARTPEVGGDVRDRPWWLRKSLETALAMTIGAASATT